jgi:putative alpha-1,2-mannosidase
MPFVSPPFAMTNWTPQTRQNKISITSYEYDDAAITGFIGTHQPAIWMGDYG